MIKTDKLLREKLSEVAEASEKIREMKGFLFKGPKAPKEPKLTKFGNSTEALVLEEGEKTVEE